MRPAGSSYQATYMCVSAPTAGPPGPMMDYASFATRRTATEQFLTSMHEVPPFPQRESFAAAPNSGWSAEERVSPVPMMGAPEQAALWMPFLQSITQSSSSDESDSSKLTRWQISPNALS